MLRKLRLLRAMAFWSLASLLAATGSARAATVTTIVFNGDNVINQFAASPSSMNLGSRILYQNYGVEDPSGGPYTTTASTYNDPADYASFVADLAWS